MRTNLRDWIVRRVPPSDGLQRQYGYEPAQDAREGGAKVIVVLHAEIRQLQ